MVRAARTELLARAGGAIKHHLRVWRIPLGIEWRGSIFYLLLLAIVAYLAVSLLRPMFVSYDDWTRIFVSAAADRILEREVMLPDDHGVVQDVTNPVTVVLFGDQDLDELGLAYPIPYAAHAEVIETILAYQPRAIFVDFLFLKWLDAASAQADAQAQVDIVALRKLICGSGSGSEYGRKFVVDKDRVQTRIYFPTPAASVLGAAPRAAGKWLATELAACADGAVLVPLEPHGSAGQLAYPPGARDVDGDWLKTPAFAIARDLKVLKEVGPDSPTMEIFWRSGLDNNAARLKSCEPQTPMAAIGALFKPAYTTAFCPTQEVVGVYRLLSGAMTQERRNELFADRVVFYGGNFVGAGDAVRTPVGDYTPGVFVHAMAMHNLLAFKDDYKRNSGRASVAYNAVLAVVAAVLAVGARNLGLTQFSRRPLFYPLGYASWGSLPRDEKMYAIVLAAIWSLGLAVVASGHTSAGVLLVLLAYLVWKTEGVLMLWYIVVSGISLLLAFYLLNLGALSAIAVITLLAVTRKVDDLMCQLEDDYKTQGNRSALGAGFIEWLARLVESTRPDEALLRPSTGENQHEQDLNPG